MEKSSCNQQAKGINKRSGEMSTPRPEMKNEIEARVSSCTRCHPYSPARERQRMQQRTGNLGNSNDEKRRNTKLPTDKK